VAIPFENGKVELWKTDPRENDLEEISKMVLCDDVLSLIKFFNNGEACIVTSLTTGRFYYVNVSITFKINDSVKNILIPSPTTVYYCFS